MHREHNIISFYSAHATRAARARPRARSARAQRAPSTRKHALYQHANTKIFRIPHRAHTCLTNEHVQGRRPHGNTNLNNK